MIEPLVCVIPGKLSTEPENDDLPHPDIDNAFISPQGNDFLVDLWIFNANPFHAAQPVPGRTTSSGFKIINRGRKIATRGKVSVTFEPSEQVLADRIVFYSQDKQDMGGVKVACLLDGGEKKEIGFLNLFNGETITVGWNCEMTSAELRIPWIAVGWSRAGPTTTRSPGHGGDSKSSQSWP